MNPDKYKAAWQQYKLMHGHLQLAEEEVIALLAPPKTSRIRSLVVNLAMLLTLLLVCY